MGPARPGLTGRGLAWAGVAMSALAPAFWWLAAWVVKEAA
jgi:hypothetical protein